MEPEPDRALLPARLRSQRRSPPPLRRGVLRPRPERPGQRPERKVPWTCPDLPVVAAGGGDLLRPCPLRLLPAEIRQPGPMVRPDPPQPARRDGPPGSGPLGISASGGPFRFEPSALQSPPRPPPERRPPVRVRRARPLQRLVPGGWRPFRRTETACGDGGAGRGGVEGLPRSPGSHPRRVRPMPSFRFPTRVLLGSGPRGEREQLRRTGDAFPQAHRPGRSSGSLSHEPATALVQRTRVTHGDTSSVLAASRRRRSGPIHERGGAGCLPRGHVPRPRTEPPGIRPGSRDRSRAGRPTTRIQAEEAPSSEGEAATGSGGRRCPGEGRSR